MSMPKWMSSNQSLRLKFMDDSADNLAGFSVNAYQVEIRQSSWSGVESIRGRVIRGNRRLEHTCLAKADEILLTDDIFAVNYPKVVNIDSNWGHRLGAGSWMSNEKLITFIDARSIKCFKINLKPSGGL